MMNKTMRLTSILLIINVIVVGSLISMTILLPIQEISPLSSLTVNNAFAQSAENEEEGDKADAVEEEEEKERKEKTEDNQDQSADEADSRSSSELKDEDKDNEEEKREHEMDEENDGSNTLISPAETERDEEEEEQPEKLEDEEDINNHPPRADAGDDEEVNEGQEVTLSAKGSTDEDGDTLTFSWRQITSQSNELELEDSKSSEVKFTAPKIERNDNEGDAQIIFRVELTASDGEFEDKDIIEITVDDDNDGRNNEESEESDGLQEEKIAKGNELDKNSDEHENIKEGSKEDKDNSDYHEKADIDQQSNDSTNLLLSQSMSNYRNNSQDILLEETTITDSDYADDVERQDGNASEILDQKTNSSTSESGLELPPSSSSLTSSLSSLSFHCGPMPVNVVVFQGSKSSLLCNINNPTIHDIDLTITCSGLEEFGIGCLVQTDSAKSVVSIDRMSDKTFPVIIATNDRSSMPEIGSYPFLITADCNTDLCKKP